MQELRRLPIKSVVLSGIEAHVCIQQTALDLIEQGYEVHIVADGTYSQRDADRDVAFERMRSAGAFVTTAESALFMLLGDKDSPSFKAISQLCIAHFKKQAAAGAGAAADAATAATGPRL
jgi:hypothetical protein